MIIKYRAAWLQCRVQAAVTNATRLRRICNRATSMLRTRVALKVGHELHQIRHVTLTIGWLDGRLTLNSTKCHILYQTFRTIDP